MQVSRLIWVGRGDRGAGVTLGLIDARRDKAKIYFALANSFGRIVDLGNVANTVFC